MWRKNKTPPKDLSQQVKLVFATPFLRMQRKLVISSKVVLFDVIVVFQEITCLMLTQLRAR